MVSSFVINAKVTVGASNQNILLDQNNRKVLFLRNSSTGGQDITIALSDGAAVANEGIVLSPGQAYTESTSESFQCWDGKVQAIASGVGAVLSVFVR